jgi:hypothetical protein
MRVKALTTVFVDNGLRVEGDEFEYNGPPNHHLECLDGDPKKKPAAKKTAPSDTEQS